MLPCRHILYMVAENHFIREVADRERELTPDKNLATNDRIKEFVDAMSAKRQSHEFYAEERNTTVDKAAEDDFLGKKGEVFALLYLRDELGFPSIKVDLEIRHGAKKGWTVDLPFSQADDAYPDVHVKTCHQKLVDYVGDYSWTFQYANKNAAGGRDDIFGGPDDVLVAFVFVERPYARQGTIKAIFPWKDVKHLLREPKKEDKQGLKKCIYYADLKALIENGR